MAVPNPTAGDDDDLDEEMRTSDDLGGTTDQFPAPLPVAGLWLRFLALVTAKLGYAAVWLCLVTLDDTTDGEGPGGDVPSAELRSLTRSSMWSRRVRPKPSPGGSDWPGWCCAARARAEFKPGEEPAAGAKTGRPAGVERGGNPPCWARGLLLVVAAPKEGTPQGEARTLKGRPGTTTEGEDDSDAGGVRPLGKGSPCVGVLGRPDSGESLVVVVLVNIGAAALE